MGHLQAAFPGLCADANSVKGALNVETDYESSFAKVNYRGYYALVLFYQIGRTMLQSKFSFTKLYRVHLDLTPLS